MAVSSPKVPVFCIVRGRWYQTTDLFDNRDWLVKTYADWFVAGSGSATVPLVESGPKPPTAGGGSGSGGADPRVDGLIARIVALETSGGGGGADPRVDGLIARVGEVEAAAGKATEKAEKAAVTASTAVSEAGNAKAAAEQATVAAGQAKLKADEVSGELGTVRSQVGSAEAKATAAESKAVEAANTAQQAQLSVISADQTAKAAKAVTDNLERLGVPNTYTTLQTTVRLAKQSADNAEIIAQGVGNKVSDLETWKGRLPDSASISGAVTKIDGYPDAARVETAIEEYYETKSHVEQIEKKLLTLPSTVAEGLSFERVRSSVIRSGERTANASLPEGLIMFKPEGIAITNSEEFTFGMKAGGSGRKVRIGGGGTFATKHGDEVTLHSNDAYNPHAVYDGEIYNSTRFDLVVYAYKIVSVDF